VREQIVRSQRLAPGATFLQDATPDRLLQAVAANHRHWMSQNARVRGGELHRENGVTWVYAPGAADAPPGGRCGTVEILFPRMSRAKAAEQLDAILEYSRRHRPLQHVSCWSLKPARELGVMLAARGFEWGWQPHWMWLDLQRMRTDHPTPHDLRIEPIEDTEVWEVEELPYYSRDAVTHLHDLARARPRRMWHFGAWLEGKPVGHSILYLTTGRLGVAGIFDVGVVAAVRNRGVGTAVTLAACRFAQAIGCRHALLNATGLGEPVYRRIGFETIGHGQTWWLHRETLEAPPPTAMQVALAEVVGRGDLAALDKLGSQVSPGALDAPLPGGTTLMELAVTTEQPAAAEWLTCHGATLDVISAWDLGWKDRVPQLLAASPELANARLGKEQITPLNVAARGNDLGLARLLLAAGPNLTVQDTYGAGTPLHNAAWRGNIAMVRLLLEQGAPLEAANRYGGTPLTTTLHGAVNCRNPQGDYTAVVAALIAAGASVNGPWGDGRPLRSAAEIGHLETAGILLENGADPNLKDDKGRTALHIALGRGDDKMAELLGRHGAIE
jgi:ankyrin repeat protein/GNAT superfamily N-acetyltransferase